MPQTGMDYWMIGGIAIAAIGLLIAWKQLRKDKPSGKNTDVDVNRSERVEIDATDASKANVGINRSKDVSINIGGSSDKNN